MINKIARAITTNLLVSAKSTRARIMFRFLSHHSSWLLSEHVVQDQGVRDHLLAWFEPRGDLLQTHVVLEQVSTDDLHAAKLAAGSGHVEKIAIVHVQDR